MTRKVELQPGETLVDKNGNLIARRPSLGNFDSDSYAAWRSFPGERYSRLCEDDTDPSVFVDELTHFVETQEAFRRGDLLPEGAQVIREQDVEAFAWLLDVNQQVLPLFTSRP